MRTVKESSDELNAPVITHAFLAHPRRRKSWRDYLALAIATCGVGLMPLAPGTWGSAVGVAFYLGLRFFAGHVLSGEARYSFDQSSQSFHFVFTTLLLFVIVILALVGTWAATRVEPLLGRKDPGAVVIDEVVGQLMTFLFVPFVAGWWSIVAGFIAFRVFDIWKPYPIRRLEALEAGLGVMADDLLAAAYAATLMSLLTSLYLIL